LIGDIQSDGGRHLCAAHALYHRLHTLQDVTGRGSIFIGTVNDAGSFVSRQISLKARWDFNQRQSGIVA
jgi:hypothetical protein